MRVLKIHVPVTHRYPFMIFIFYSLQILSTDTYEFFWYPWT